MITLNPLELLASVTIMSVCRLIMKKTKWNRICTNTIDLILNPTLGEVFNQLITLYLIYIFINPQY
jgi:hypothetical protein